MLDRLSLPFVALSLKTEVNLCRMIFVLTIISVNEISNVVKLTPLRPYIPTQQLTAIPHQKHRFTGRCAVNYTATSSSFENSLPSVNSMFLTLTNINYQHEAQVMLSRLPPKNKFEYTEILSFPKQMKKSPINFLSEE
jgi:hypothetical protein